VSTMLAPLDSGAQPFVVELEHFSGPLDLLLTLIREEQVEIADIPIARICEQFLLRIHSLGLSEAAEYLEMAAGLLRIKVQMLLPRRGDDEEWDDPRAELVRRLLEYQQMREVVAILQHRGDDRRDRFSRGYLPQPAAAPLAPLALSLPELLAAVDRVLRISREPLMHDVISRALDVDGAIDTILSVLAHRGHAAGPERSDGDQRDGHHRRPRDPADHVLGLEVADPGQPGRMPDRQEQHRHDHGRDREADERRPQVADVLRELSVGGRLQRDETTHRERADQRGHAVHWPSVPRQAATSSLAAAFYDQRSLTPRRRPAQ